MYEVTESSGTSHQWVEKSGQFLCIRAGLMGYLHIPLDAIMYAESKGRLIKLYLVDHRYTFYGVLREMEQELKERRFARVHKSYVVNFDYVRRIHHEKIHMGNGEILPLSRSKGRFIREEIAQYNCKKQEE